MRLQYSWSCYRHGWIPGCEADTATFGSTAPRGICRFASQFAKALLSKRHAYKEGIPQQDGREHFHRRHDGTVNHRSPVRHIVISPTKFKSSALVKRSSMARPLQQVAGTPSPHTMRIRRTAQLREWHCTLGSSTPRTKGIPGFNNLQPPRASGAPVNGKPRLSQSQFWKKTVSRFPEVFRSLLH